MSIYDEMKEGQTRGLAHLPAEKLPDGVFLVHNHIRTAAPLNRNGFRAWVQKGHADLKLVECTCDFGGNKNAELNQHYRVDRSVA